MAHRGERGKLMDIFLRAGCVEVTATPLELPRGNVRNDNAKFDLESKKLKVSFAITFLKESYKELGRTEKDLPKADFKKINRLVAIDEYDGIANEEMEIFGKIDEMNALNSRLIDIKSEKSRLAAIKEQLTPYENLEVAFSEIKNTSTCVFLAGTVPENKLESLKSSLSDCAEITEYGGMKNICIAVVAHKHEEKSVLSSLVASDFIRCPFEYDVTAKEKIAETDARLVALDEERGKVLKETETYLSLLDSLKILYDHYGLDLAKFEAMEQCQRTHKAFVMEGWVPAEKVEELEKAVREKCALTEIFFRDPFDSETPPSLTKNSKPVNAFAGITEMFGMPNYREQDPNVFVALFYFLFFGIMISDAGYGLIMAIACFAMVKIMKPVKNSGRMLIMFGFCGISTVIWGALFGGWFGIENIGFLSHIQWFNPLQDPLKMFMLALAMGVLQIGTGFALKGIALCKAGHPVHAIFNQFSWDVIFIGLILISPKLMLFLGAVKTTYAWFDPAQQAGMYIAIAGFAMLLIGGGIGKKNPVKMVTGAFGNAYGAINVVSDLLSYSRLFGLGLTTGVIGYVVNMLADIIVNTFFGGLWVGWIIAVPVLLVGHVFNIAINLLGAYVHNSRLQYIEFFGRFYEGSGRAFKPLGSGTQYTYPDN